SGAVVTTLGGEPGVDGSSNGAGSSARFNNPQGIAIGSSGSLYIADTKNNTIRIGGPAPGSQLLNISTRLRVQTDDNVLIGGFILTGSVPKKVIIRAIGPSLGNFGIAGALSDPVLELRDGAGALLKSNDNWKIDDENQQSQEASIVATTIPPSNDLESAIIATLPPQQGFTAIVRGQGDTTGIAVIEVYDLNSTDDAILANISSRGFVDTGNNVMIGGFIVGGGAGSGKVIVRAIGPSLIPYGIGNALSDPTLELHDGNGNTVATNDNWKEGDQAAVQATGIPPSNDLESAIVATLPAGGYTAIVAGKNGGTGVGLVEVYYLP
ncbi:MAG: hypothetical protein ACXWHF_08465, partial [Chthoniobacterales bacterium]